MVSSSFGIRWYFIILPFNGVGAHYLIGLPIIEGESLFNDGVAVVLFHISFFISIPFIISGNGLDGIRSRTIIISEIQHWWSNSLEIAFSIVMIFGSYFIAEHFYVSGVIAVVVAGLIFGNYGAKVGMSDKTKMNIDSFFDTITFFANSSSFLMIGLEIKNINFSNKWGYII